MQSRRCRQTVSSPGQEDPLEEEMATHSSILAWKIPWTMEPGRLQSTGLRSQTWLKQLDMHTCRGKQQGQYSWSWVRARRVLGYELREVDWSQIRRNFWSHLKWPCKSLAVGPFFTDISNYWPSVFTTVFARKPCTNDLNSGATIWVHAGGMWGFFNENLGFEDFLSIWPNLS